MPMRKVIIAAIVLTLYICLAHSALAAAPETTLTPLSLSSNADPRVTPVISLTPDDQARVSWVEDEHIRIISPKLRWQMPTPPAAVTKSGELILTMNSGRFITWLETSPDTSTIYWQDINLPKTVISQTLTAGTIAGINHLGEIYTLRSAESSLFYSTGTAPTGRLELSAPASDLTLSFDVSGAAYVCWRQTSDSPDKDGIYYWALATKGGPVQIPQQGVRPQLQIGSLVHIAFLRGTDLVYANSADWERTYTVTTDLPQDAPFKLLLDNNGIAHLLWYQNEALYLASATNWGLETQLLNIPKLTAFDYAIDSFGRGHLVYGQLNDAGNQDIYYYETDSEFTQIALASDLEGQVISAPYTLTVYANLPAADILRVTYYLVPSEDDTSGTTVIPMGADTDGSDGWQIMLTAPSVTPRKVRACALATRVDGIQARTCSGVFTIIPEDWPDLWIDSPATVAGEPVVFAYYKAASTLSQVDLYAQPAACAAASGRCSAAGQVEYLGRTTLPGAPAGVYTRQILEFPTEALSEGYYYLSVAGVSDSGILSSTLDTPVLIQHYILPHLELFPISTTLAIGDMLEVQASVDEGSSSVNRVDFYLVHDSYLPNTAGLLIPSSQTKWLGSVNRADKWRIRVPVSPAWLGNGWRIKAVAYDEQSLLSSVFSSEQLRVVNSTYPHAKFLNLPSDGVLRGVITLNATTSASLGEGSELRLYLVDEHNQWLELGHFQPGQTSWSSQFDTRVYANGAYTLAAAVHLADASFTTPATRAITLDNPFAGFAVASPTANADVSGEVELEVSSQLTVTQVTGIDFLLQDKIGNILKLGRVSGMDNHYSFLWNSQLVIDGPYTITAQLTTVDDQITELTQSVNVSNRTPSIRFTSSDLQPQNGWLPVCWQTTGPISKAVRLEYSPDNGARWIELKDNLDASGCYSWDTRLAPD
ncbi:MAG: hypothetical protein ACYC6L_14690, partial [Anaerolineae bacterium]